MGETALQEKLEILEEKIDKLSQQIQEGFTKASFTVIEAATYLGCSEWSVYELTYQKKLKTFKVGRRVLIPRKELERFMAEGGVTKLG